MLSPPAWVLPWVFPSVYEKLFVLAGPLIQRPGSTGLSSDATQLVWACSLDHLRQWEMRWSRRCCAGARIRAFPWTTCVKAARLSPIMCVSFFSCAANFMTPPTPNNSAGCWFLTHRGACQFPISPLVVTMPAIKPGPQGEASTKRGVLMGVSMCKGGIGGAFQGRAAMEMAAIMPRRTAGGGGCNGTFWAPHGPRVCAGKDGHDSIPRARGPQSLAQEYAEGRPGTLSCG